MSASIMLPFLMQMKDCVYTNHFLAGSPLLKAAWDPEKALAALN
jgi:hypothetical protein